MPIFTMVASGKLPDIQAIEDEFGVEFERAIRTSVDLIVDAIERDTPSLHGNMVGWLSQHQVDGSGLQTKAWVAPLEGLRSNTSVAGSGFIKEFIEDYRGKRSENATPRKQTFDPRAAWFFLSDELKNALYQARVAGKYGGVSGSGPGYHMVPVYYGAQERGRAPDAYGGNQDKNTGFMKEISSEVMPVVRETIGSIASRIKFRTRDISR